MTWLKTCNLNGCVRATELPNYNTDISASPRRLCRGSIEMPTVDSVDLDYMFEGYMMILWGFPIQQHRNGGDAGQRYIGYGWDVKT